jgi:membrane-associated phospholipid phosphatase
LKESSANSLTIQKLLHMKTFIHLLLVAFVVTTATAQDKASRHFANYDAANWKLWELEHPEKIVVTPPPGATQSKAELQSIKMRMGQVDEKKLSQIRYWDAGAPAYRWNQILPHAGQKNPEVMLRIPGSWMNLAIYDATVLAWREKIRYKRERPESTDPSLTPLVNTPATYSYPCEHSATAAAAATVIAYFYPHKADSVLQLARAASQSRIEAGVQFPSDVEAGWKLGEAVAMQIIEKAKNDGSALKWDGEMNKDPKKWTGKFPMGITLRMSPTIVLRSADQFRPAPPPDFENDMKELKEFKPTFTSKATAFYWASRGDTWTELMNKKMFEYRMADDAPAVARIYTVLNTAYHDLAIAIFDAKYAYWGIRPVQYDTTYKPLIGTPPFPGYPSGHAAAAGMSSAVLEYFFPDDAEEFRALAQECADSRFYAGIHFRTDNETGLAMGRTMGKYIVETWMNEEKSASRLK